jgi:hypothetical protein
LDIGPNHFVGEQLADDEVGDDKEFAECSDDCDGELVDGGGYNKYGIEGVIYGCMICDEDDDDEGFVRLVSFD